MKWFGVFCACWYLWIPVTFWFGRVFCRYCCPLGLSQSLVNFLFHPKTHVRRVCTRLPRPWYQRAVNWAIVLAYFLAPIGCLVNPWGIFGRTLILFAPGLVYFGAVLALAVFFRGRVWCNWICPLGTIFELVAKLGWHEDGIGSRCRHCRACFPKGTRAASAAPSSVAGAVTRRETLQGLVVLAAAEKLSDGGLAPVTAPLRPERKTPVLPPGALSVRNFNLKCVGCGLCVAACPEKVLKPSPSFLSLGRPVMDFSSGHCRLACNYRCGKACPEGAIVPLAGVLRKDVHAGVAAWTRARCLRETEGVSCTACVRKCPVKAIHLVAGFPVVDAAACVGCGACEHVCPSRPLPAMVVEGVATQRVVRPLSAADLAAEMLSLVASGRAAAVVAKDGVIVRTLEGRGVAPILSALARDPSVFANALVADKVVGRAAAAVYVVGRAKKVLAPVMSEGAKALLERNGVAVAADTVAARIDNREGTGACPMDTAVEGLDDAAEIVARLRVVNG